MLQTHTFPHSHSDKWTRLDVICQQECKALIKYMTAKAQEKDGIVDIKNLVMKACANIFNVYFCGGQRRHYDDTSFAHYVDHFDRIFWEVNTGRLADFIPWMTFFTMPHIMAAKRSAGVVRK